MTFRWTWGNAWNKTKSELNLNSKLELNRTTMRVITWICIVYAWAPTGSGRSDFPTHNCSSKQSKYYHSYRVNRKSTTKWNIRCKVLLHSYIKRSQARHKWTGSGPNTGSPIRYGGPSNFRSKRSITKCHNFFSIKFTKQTRRLFRGIWIKVSTNTHATIPGADNLTTNPHYQYLIQWDPIQPLRTECKFIKFNTEKLQVEKLQFL